MTTQTILAPVLALGLTVTVPQVSVATPVAPPTDRPVDLAICLDTSGSMQGLIDAARQNIWAIVNDLALARPTPKLRIALLTFGNDGHDQNRGWVAMDTPFTNDLDVVSQKLFALTTNGGNEYVGRVLQAAVGELEWSPRPDALKLIVVAGNESAEQDPQVDFRAVCSTAISRGIVVNSIYCGNPADTIAPAWREVAVRSDGQFAAIDKDHGTVVVESPFDAKLTTLSSALNETYVPYGQGARDAQANQRAQDENARKLNQAAAAQRANCKATSNYSCATWDLVDAVKQGSVELDKLKPEDLPEALRKMTLDELRTHVKAMTEKRTEIQKTIAGLHVKREAFVKAELQRRATGGDTAFDFAVRRAVKAQAEAKGFTFPKPPEVDDATVPVSADNRDK